MNMAPKVFGVLNLIRVSETEGKVSLRLLHTHSIFHFEEPSLINKYKTRLKVLLEGNTLA